jgi:hypothetical protein
MVNFQNVHASASPKACADPINTDIRTISMKRMNVGKEAGLSDIGFFSGFTSLEQGKQHDD